MYWPIMHRTAPSIDRVIADLDTVITEMSKEQSPHGYFAVLYQGVTQSVKEAIERRAFDDNPRMEQLDLVFAERYLDAYRAWRSAESPTSSWQATFDLSGRYWPIVLQHLLAGINAHINLDLGIAAAQVAPGDQLPSLKNDFNRINTILADLVEEVQQKLVTIWPPLRWILKRTGQIDNLLVDFSMQLARDGAWQFAKKLAQLPAEDWQAAIQERDRQVAQHIRLIAPQSLLLRLIFFLARLGELGTVAQKIHRLRG